MNVLNKRPIFELNRLEPYQFWKSIGNPKFVCAPMVDQSELAFRILTRKYGVDLAYTPMIHSVIFTTHEKYREQWLKDISSDIDSPKFVQFCGHDPEILLRAAKLVEGKCEAIDLNLGCPQGIAKRGNYGSFLLDDTDLVLKIVGYLANNLVHSALTCKIRIFPDLSKTFQLVKDLEQKGIKVLTVHGRTKEEKGQKVLECNFDAIKQIKKIVNIPVIANGGIERYEDAIKCLEYTNCDAIMSSEGLLENPTLFSGTKINDIDSIALEYLDLSKSLANDIDFVRAHMFKFMYRGLQDDPELNQVLGKCKSYDDFIEFAQNMKLRRSNMELERKLGWYRRYRTYDINGNVIEKDKTINKRKPKDIGYEDNGLLNLDEDVMCGVSCMFDDINIK